MAPSRTNKSPRPTESRRPHSSESHHLLFIAGGAIALNLLASKATRGWFRDRMEQLVNLLPGKLEVKTRARRLEIWRHQVAQLAGGTPNAAQNQALLNSNNNGDAIPVYNQAFERGLFQVGLNVGGVFLEEKELIWCYSHAKKQWTMQTALLVSSKAQVATISPAAARALGFLDPTTGAVLPAHRPRLPKNLLENLFGLNPNYTKVGELQVSIAGREVTIVTVVEEMLGSNLAGEAYLVLPSSLVHSLGLEGMVSSKVVKKLTAPLSKFELAMMGRAIGWEETTHQMRH